MLHLIWLLAFFLRSLGGDRNRSDDELLRQYLKTGNQLHAAELFERYAHLIFGICMKYLKDEEKAKDAAMGIYEKLLKELKKFEVGNFKSWLYTLTKNYCLMQLRSERTKEKNATSFLIEQEAAMENGAFLHLFNESDKEQALQQLEEALKELKEEQRVCLELFYLQEKSYTEVAETTGYDMKAVKSYIQNGKRNLKIKLDNSNG